MKRRIWIGLGLVVLLLLPACSREPRQVQGLVTEVQIGEDGGLTAFVVRTQGGEQVGVLLTERTAAFPSGGGLWLDDELRAAFQEELEVDVQISAACLRPKKTLATRDGQEIAAYVGDYVAITGKMNRGAVTLADGTPVDVLVDSNYASPSRIYYLNGTELLWVPGPSGPEHHYVAGLEGLDGLGEAARAKVLDFYEERGLLYDEGEELERAYADWQKKGEDFCCHLVEQSISPSASSEQVIYFGTHAILPVEPDHEDNCTSYQVDRYDAFDRATGERIDTWDLFAAPREEVIRTVLDKAESVESGLEAVPWEGRIHMTPDQLSVSFEPYALPGRTHGYGFSVDLETVSDLIQPWAIPER